MVVGEEKISSLSSKAVIVFGLGGVGGPVCEALIRSGLGRICLVDGDVVDYSNLNRQIIATLDAIGRHKVQVMQERLQKINSKAQIEAIEKFYNKDTADDFDLQSYDYIVDCIDMISSKLLLAENAKKACKKIISSMGTGNKLDPSLFEVADIKDTSICPLARVMRRELKKRNIENLKVVYSKEAPRKPLIELDDKSTPGSMSFVPPVAGYILAGEVLKDLMEIR